MELDCRRYRLDGYDIHARVSERARGTPPVLLVHGVGVSSRYMTPLAAALAPAHTVYAPDLPGFGLSSKPRHVLSIPALADLLARFLDAERVPEAVVVAHSFGCQVAVDLALRHERRVAGALLAAPTVDPCARTWTRQIARLLRGAFAEPPSLLPLVLADYLQSGPRRILRTFALALRDPIREKLRRVRRPVLVVRGSRDPITPARWVAEAARLLPDGTAVTIPGHGHAVNFSAAPQVAGLLRDFAARLRYRREPAYPGP